jgi:hypothetical protein
VIAAEMCRILAAFRANPGAFDPAACRDQACLHTVSRAIVALETITHESYHLLGYRNEAQTECYGLQSLWYAATRLGAPARLAQTLAAAYALQMYPSRRTGAHPEYWSAECRDGGKLDLRPKSHAWPS